MFSVRFVGVVFRSVLAIEMSIRFQFLGGGGRISGREGVEVRQRSQSEPVRENLAPSDVGLAVPRWGGWIRVGLVHVTVGCGSRFQYKLALNYRLGGRHRSQSCHGRI